MTARRRRYVWTAEEFAAMNGVPVVRPRRRPAQSRPVATHPTEAYVRSIITRPMRLIVDVVDGCNLRCVDCPSGQRPREPRFMSPALFGEILDKFLAEGANRRPRPVALYNWSEPFLHPQIHEIVAECTARGVGSDISSNQSLRWPRIEETVEAGLTRLVVSVSGWDQRVHKRYHRGSNIEVVRDNIERAVAARDATDSRLRINVRYLKFRNNSGEDQLGPWRRFCRERGLFFDAYAAIAQEDSTSESARWMLAPTKAVQVPGSVDDLPSGHVECRLHRWTVLDVDGTNHICCRFWTHNALEVGDFLETPAIELVRRKVVHPACKVCRFRVDRRAAAVLPQWLTDEGSEGA